MILSQEEERKKLLKEALKAELRSAAKDLLEEIALAERKLFCKQNEDVCNGYYSLGLDGLFGKIDVRVPRTRDISRTVGALIDGNYSANWVSKITDVVQEKVEAYRDWPIKKWYPIVFIDETVINIRRGSVDTAEPPRD
jgi:transposase-like protein